MLPGSMCWCARCSSIAANTSATSWQGSGAISGPSPTSMPGSKSRGLNGQLRAESLNVEEFIGLAQALRERWGGTFGTTSAGDREEEDRESDPE